MPSPLNHLSLRNVRGSLRILVIFGGFLSLVPVGPACPEIPRTIPAGTETASAAAPLSKTSDVGEWTGIIRRERAHGVFRRFFGDEVLVLQCEDEAFFLIRGRDKRIVARLEPLVGLKVKVQGEVIPKNARHDRRAIKVGSFSEEP